MTSADRHDALRRAGARLALTLLGASASTLAASGCAGSASPTIRLADARVTERTPEGIAVEFILEGVNDNEEELPLQRVLYSLSIDGERVFRGERMAEATLRRRGAQTFVLPVSVRWDDLPPEARGEGDADSVFRYRLTGVMQYIAPGALAEVFFDTGVRRPSVRFAAEGEFTFSNALADEPQAR